MKRSPAKARLAQAMITFMHRAPGIDAESCLTTSVIRFESPPQTMRSKVHP